MLLCLDLSLTSTGYAVLNSSYTPIEVDRIVEDKFKRIPKDADKNTKRECQFRHDTLRIQKICNKVKNLIHSYDIKRCVIEDQFGGKSVKTSMQLAKLLGAVSYVLQDNDVIIDCISPMKVREVLTNNGGASKGDIATFLINFYKDNDVVQSIGEYCDRVCKSKTSDMYDALALGVFDGIKKGLLAHDGKRI